MSDPTHDACRHAGVGRRGFLGLAGGTLASAGLASLLGAAPASAAPVGGRPDVPLRFALVTDTHVNVDSPQSTVWLTQVWASIAARDPDLVLHCGDITDTGRPDEFDRYAEVLPTALHGKLHYSPGNHDVRWDPSAKEEYRTHFGPGPYSFDAGGVHFIGFDPTEVLQEPGHYGPGGLEWLKADLKRLRPGTPTVLFQHFPMGNTFYYVDDQPEVLDVLADHHVRGIFAYHIHKEVVSGFNGLTQVGLNAVRNGALYYWVERTRSADGTPVLRVSRVDIAADGTETEVPVSDMPLAQRRPGPSAAPPRRQPRQGRPRSTPGHRPAGQERPGHLRGGGPLPADGLRRRRDPGMEESHRQFGTPVDRLGRRLLGRARHPAAAPPGHRGGRVLVGGHRPVRGRTRRGRPAAALAVPVAGLGPGRHRPHRLRREARGGRRFHHRRCGRDPSWRPRHPRAPVARTGRTGVPQARGRRRARTLFIPSTDHRLYALKAADGRQKWRFDAGAPVLSAPLVAEVLGRERVFFSAGQNLFALDAASGGELWSVPGRGFSSGRAASDGDRVYTAADDGYARAHDAATGEQLWAFAMATGTENHVALYSGWDNVVAVGDGVVVVGSVAGSWGLSATTGALLWKVAKQRDVRPDPRPRRRIGPAHHGVRHHVPGRPGDGQGPLADQPGGARLQRRSSDRRRRRLGPVGRRQAAGGEAVGRYPAGPTAAQPGVLVQHSGDRRGTLVVGDQNGVVAGIELP
ncbi:PQQ-binding-like beta-propeller repeat protein [Streptomyces kaempferi]